MKKSLSILIYIICLVVGYILGSNFPYSGFIGNKINIADNNSPTLTVNVVNDKNEPMVGIEVDVAIQPGPPEDWGVKEANTNGIVKYNLEPGDYYVFFNMSRFPQRYIVPSEKKVTIREGASEEITFILISQ